jgi:hypothetical protein
MAQIVHYNIDFIVNNIDIMFNSIISYRYLLNPLYQSFPLYSFYESDDNLNKKEIIYTPNYNLSYEIENSKNFYKIYF